MGGGLPGGFFEGFGRVFQVTLVSQDLAVMPIIFLGLILSVLVVLLMEVL